MMGGEYSSELAPSAVPFKLSAPCHGQQVPFASAEALLRLVRAVDLHSHSAVGYNQHPEGNERQRRTQDDTVHRLRGRRVEVARCVTTKVARIHSEDLVRTQYSVPRLSVRATVAVAAIVVSRR